ncbi:hypothetical protein V6N13_004312 [Hibiscus sabdariffa]|uniref:Uncharacterized protein n=1 Tax=Hibiscus sabdariffa TaxID=183260 RepID=A0ABR2RY37_9ROSI
MNRAVKIYSVLTEAYGYSSFQDCKQASEEAIVVIVKKLAGKLFSDSEAAVLLKQLDFPICTPTFRLNIYLVLWELKWSWKTEVDSLQVKLLEKLEESLADLQLKTNDIENVFMESNDPKQGKVSDSIHITAHEVMK